MTNKPTMTTMDGNEATAYVAYRVTEISAIFPITPSSPMGEHADSWAAEGIKNIWGHVPQVVEMQSEGGASGTLHGTLQTGALATTYTASQGLLLMIPNMHKIAGELTSAVMHVSARSLAIQALSIFGDHSDVMDTRATGFAMLCSGSVQEAHDLALITHAATLEARVPFLHFFEGFRTSHELNKFALLTEDQMREMIDDDLVLAHRKRALSSDHPFIRGTSQNPDVYFQAREACNPFYEITPAIVQKHMDKFAAITGRQYHLMEYFGDKNAERVIVVMGSGAEVVKETVKYLNQQGEKVGLLQVYLYRPFSSKALIDAIPASVKTIAVLDRTKEAGADGEPLYKDVVTALYTHRDDLPMKNPPRVIGGRYGLSSKEFTPAMVKGIFAELAKAKPKNHFTIGINDDVSNTSLEYDEDFDIESDEVVRAMFFGLGADGTVGANKNSIKIIGSKPEYYAQGYFVYDSKKSGARTVSHLRFGKHPISAPYLIRSANFIGCHQFNFLEKTDVLKYAAHGATFLLNSTYSAEEVWHNLPRPVQQEIIDKEITFYVIDAYDVAKKTGMGERINTIMQTCFFELANVMPVDEAITEIKAAIKKTYGKKGEEIVNKNYAAVDQAIANLKQVKVPDKVDSDAKELPPVVAENAPKFVREVIATIMADRGDELPVSAMPIDGTFPSATTKWEKRNVSLDVACWDPETCIQCGRCSIVCPHGVIRAKRYAESDLKDAPAEFKSTDLRGKDVASQKYTLQVYLEDCTGCGLCVEACPAKNKQEEGKKAINLVEKEPILEQERKNIEFFEKLPEVPHKFIDSGTVPGVQYLKPMFEFSGACAGCGETPYVKLVSQLFGDRMVVANATGCSSIYGGNLPTTPWTVNEENRGPAWSNSLFEDNAEFGLGFRLTENQLQQQAKDLLTELSSEVGDDLVKEILAATDDNEEEKIKLQRERVAKLKEKLEKIKSDKARHLLSLADRLVKHSIWIIGGDGWAYDIGFGGLDHVLASGHDVNVLVLDTEVYSNTGGQASKATPLGAIAKFAASGKKLPKKDLGLMMMSYGYVYVAQISLANPMHAIKAIKEAEAYHGPAIILAYSHCIAHGINMRKGLMIQKMAMESGFWPLYSYNPELAKAGKQPFVLSSQKPKISFKEYAYDETRFKSLAKLNPHEAEELLQRAQAEVDYRWCLYEHLANQEPCK
ncbi:MAG: pyruvate:ferredoxin (flavodoxin) oxidoreductase [Gammaproteobacteria bacterium]